MRREGGRRRRQKTATVKITLIAITSKEYARRGERKEVLTFQKCEWSKGS